MGLVVVPACHLHWSAVLREPGPTPREITQATLAVCYIVFA